MDAKSEGLLSVINPHLARKVQEMACQYAAAYPDDELTVVQGFRGWNAQDALYAQGRTASGPIVTHARGGHSWHEFGLAVDVCPQSLRNTHNWSPDDSKWKMLEDIGISLGLFPGAKFSDPDRPHFQLTGKYPVTPNDEVRQIYQMVGMVAVWIEAGLFSQGDKA